MKVAVTLLTVYLFLLTIATATARDQRVDWASLNQNFHQSLRLAASTFRVSYQWLHACAHSEGGHGFIYSNSGSGAFGPFQFIRSTFYGNVGAAFQRAAARGTAIPIGYERWDSYLGQSFTAAYMFSIGESYEWTGAAC